MTPSLHPCPACQRHILASETACPFCSAETDFSATKARALPTRRMSRAALVAFSALAAAAPAAACGGDTEERDPVGDGDGDGDMSGDGDGDAVFPVYGIPATGGADGFGGSGMGGEEPSGGTGGELVGTGGELVGTGGELVGPVYGIPSDPVD